ncbi:MAG: guanylate kinase [Negativicutes bacterium]|nr:guanylate kinase [Negativicutes bacterium]
MTQQGVLIVLSGPSGTGKGTICKQLLRSYPNLHYSVSATTRAPREGEIDGVNYWFVSKDDFMMMVESDELLEWAEVYGNFYGTPRRYVQQQLDSGKDVVLEIDIQGAMQIKSKFPQGVFIYIIPPSLDELANRIYRRGTDSPDSIRQRLSCASSELAYACQYHYVVVNDSVEAAVKKIEAILTAEKCKVDRNSDLIDTVCQCGTTE